ncbi:MAG: PRC-barrel domain-containing protein [Clostridia bacterium]|nr:PRC-barrel domain-containing protein [Clostridia bacterium]
MNLLSEIVSKPVLNLYTGKIEGTVSSIVFDDNYKKIRYLKIFDKDEEEYSIDSSKIYSVGKNSVVIKNSEALILNINQISNKDNNPINTNIYTTTGDWLGKLTDIQFNERFEVENFISNENKIQQKNLVNIGENIIVNTSDKQIKLNNLKPKIKNQMVSTQNVITIMPKIENPTIENKPKMNYKISQGFTPQKIVSNSNFLIGRKALKTIYGLNHEIIIKKDNLINEKILDIAKKHSKIMELTVFSKTK